MYESSIENIYMPSTNTARSDLSGINRNIGNHQRAIEKANRELTDIVSRLKELEQGKEQLSIEMATEKEEYKKFTVVIEEINKAVRKVEKQFEPLNESADNTKQKLLRSQFELERSLQELKMLGYESPVEAEYVDVAVSESLVDGLQGEFDSLSRKLNMNAAILYQPQKENYKNLSDRINKLEEERGDILKFMETIEKEKRDTFFSALEKLNKKFSETFSAITEGKGSLQLQNPEDPSSGGLDILVEFPGKSQMLVTAASGGEKSVVAVSYIFALQSLTKSSPFYIFDEIDAHLDAVNTRRLADLLSKEAGSSQILAISLKEPVATQADRVFGVYAKNGVSCLVSLPQLTVEVPA